MTERITAAAIMLEDGRVFHEPPPARHHTVLHALYGKGIDHKGHDQGFWTSAGRYVGRIEAMEIAVAAGQVMRRNLPDYAGPELFSEDLW